MKYSDSLLTHLSNTNDINAFLDELYHEGYVASNYVSAMQVDTSSWQQYCEENEIQKIKLTLFHAVTEDEEVTSTENSRANHRSRHVLLHQWCLLLPEPDERMDIVSCLKRDLAD